MHPRFTPTLQRAALCAFTLAAALMTPHAHAALQDRDLDGDTVVDAFYDTDLDITCLRNANVNGAQDWDTQVAWASNFSFGGYDDWRLPTTDTSCSGSNCTGSEMGHLYYVELGNVASVSPINTGAFQNLQGQYWSGTPAVSDSGGAWQFSFDLPSFPFVNGIQFETGKFNPLPALVVRGGDVLPAVPEPATGAMLTLGLGGLAVATRRRTR